jgi:CheY-like chemotaxis protein
MISQHADILVVEDNPSDVDLMRAALDAAGCSAKLHVATDGEDALAFLRREGEHRTAPHPALVLLDLNLPRLDGRAVLRKKGEDSEIATIPVILMSSSDMPGDIRDAYALGANCYVCKSVDLDEFFETVASIMSFWLGTATLPP